MVNSPEQLNVSFSVEKSAEVSLIEELLEVFINSVIFAEALLHIVFNINLDDFFDPIVILLDFFVHFGLVVL